MKMETIKSNKWLYKIKIKHLFKETTTPGLIDKLCGELVKQLQKILKEVEEFDMDGNMCEELETCIDYFGFLQKMANGGIETSKWHEYGFEGDFEEEFNGYFEQLYDLADERVIKKGTSYKFIWIE